MKMSTFAGFLSVSLWSAALLFSPAPAEATWVQYPAVSNYFACAQYETSSTPGWCDLYFEGMGEHRVWFDGYMRQTVPTGSCSGACNGTAWLMVDGSISNGRHARVSDWQQCGSSYAYELDICTSCSGT